MTINTSSEKVKMHAAMCALVVVHVTVHYGYVVDGNIDHVLVCVGFE
jgi:hypothetical protein